MPELSTAIEHVTSAYNSQNEDTSLVAGWKIEAQVIGITGRRFMPVLVAICPDEVTAQEITELLNAKYGVA